MLYIKYVVKDLKFKNWPILRSLHFPSKAILNISYHLSGMLMAKRSNINEWDVGGKPEWPIDTRLVTLGTERWGAI